MEKHILGIIKDPVTLTTLIIIPIALFLIRGFFLLVYKTICSYLFKFKRDRDKKSVNETMGFLTKQNHNSNSLELQLSKNKNSPINITQIVEGEKKN